MRRVGNVELDGSTITTMIGRTPILTRKTSYADKLETEAGSHQGSQAIDFRTPGAYTTEEGSFTVTSAVFRSDLAPLFQTNGFGVEQIPIVFSYSHPDLGDDSDLCSQCRITNIAAATEAGQKALEVEIKFVTNQIYWGNDRKTINKLDPSVPLGQSNF